MFEEPLYLLVIVKTDFAIVDRYQPRKRFLAAGIDEHSIVTVYLL